VGEGDRAVGEARLERTKYGVAAVTEGWFTVNVRDAAWTTNDKFGAACIFEGEDVAFGHVGYTVHVLEPGQPNGLYHYEDDQEDFLVLSGECIAIVEDEERRMGPWDFLHCPPGTRHIFVGAGDGPCVIFMAGGRAHRGTAVYPYSETAVHHQAGVEKDAPEPHRPYGPYPKWQPGPPASFDGLPFG
jgi:uncharacterized cupin superfamily protein